MKKSVKVFFVVLSLFIVLILFGPIYKNLNVEAQVYKSEIGNYLYYNESKYYMLKDIAPNYINNGVLYENDSWYWEYEHPYIYKESDMNSENKYYRRTPVFPNIFAVYRFCTFNNDSKNNFLYIPNDSFIGASYGWLCIKENAKFPTLYNSDVKSLYVGRNLIFLENTDDYSDIIECIKNHEDFTQFLPDKYKESWKELYIQYKDFPLYECVATDDNGNIVWNKGGTP